MTTPRSIGLVVAGALAGAGAAVLTVLGLRSTVAGPSRAPVEATATAVRASGSTDDPRQRMNLAVTETLRNLGPNSDLAAVNMLLAQLEQRARQKGAVTALEMEPAFAALDTLTPTIGVERVRAYQAEFAGKMSQLSAELQPAAAAPSSAPPMEPAPGQAITPESVLAELARTTDPGNREALLRDLSGLLASRPADEQRKYIEQARRLLPPVAEAPTP